MKPPVPGIQSAPGGQTHPGGHTPPGGHTSSGEQTPPAQASPGVHTPPAQTSPGVQPPPAQTSPGVQPPPRPVDGATWVLHDGAVESYLERALALLREARLGAQFPSGRAVVANLEALRQRCHRGLYPQLQVERGSGLPALKEWTRVLTDTQVAQQVVAGLPPPEQLRQRASRDAAYGKQLLKWLYYSELLQKPPPPVEQLTVALQKLDAAAGSAQVQLTLDKIDTHGLLRRCTVELVQAPAARPVVTRVGDEVTVTPELQGLLYRRAAHDAELLFIELAALPGVTVRRVSIGTIGPLLLAELPVAGGLGALLGGPGSALASFGTDIAASDLTADRDNDPLTDLLADRLSPAARAEYEKCRQRLGYRVTKDRKFVVDSASLAAVTALCQAARTRNVIYPLRPPAL